MNQEQTTDNRRTAPAGPAKAPGRASDGKPKGKEALKAKGKKFGEKTTAAYVRTGTKILNKVSHPMGNVWWLGFVVIIVAWVLLPIKRARTPIREAYANPWFRALHGPFWGTLGWLGVSLVLFASPFLHPALQAEWGRAWFGLTIRQLPFMALYGLAWGGVLMALGWFGLVMFRLMRESHRAGEHGGAAWAARGEIILAKDRRWTVPMMVHFRGVRRNWTWGDSGAALTCWGPPDPVCCTHVLLLGATGSGKGASIFSHIMMSSTVPVIYQDVKAECPCLDDPRWKTAIRWGAAADGGWPSMRWNPLQEAIDDPDPESAFETLASMLLPDDAKGGQGSSAWVEKIGRPILAEGLRSGRWKTLGDFADSVRDKPLEKILQEMAVPGGLQHLLQGENVKEYVASSFFSNLASYRQGWGRDVTSAHDFSLEDLIQRGGYILSAEAEEARSLPLRLMWRMLFRKLMRSTKPVPLTILMDEGLAAGKIPSLRQALETLRNRKVSLWMGIQTESGLLDVYEMNAGKAIIDTFGNRITLLHGLDPTDAKNLSERMRTYTLVRRSPKQAAQKSPVQLLMPQEIEKRGRRLRDRWAIIDARESTISSLPIIARMVAVEMPTRRPSETELEAELAKYPRAARPNPADATPYVLEPKPKRKRKAKFADETGGEPSMDEVPWPDERHATMYDGDID